MGIVVGIIAGIQISTLIYVISISLELIKDHRKAMEE